VGISRSAGVKPVGTNSTFDTNTAVYVGGQYNPSSNNTIEVKSGGTLNTGVGFIGRRAGATYNSVLVTGANSTWSAEGIEVGGEGTFNSMNVTAGAAVTAETAFVGARTRNTTLAWARRGGIEIK
jgi:T5SS/PEP-CTERM-associated repeat protein